MNVYYDLDTNVFTTKPAAIIDIGVIADNGEWFYAEFNDYGEIPSESSTYKEIVTHLKLVPPKEGEKEYYIRHNHHAVNGEGAFSLEMRGNRRDVSENLRLWFQQFGDERVQLVSDRGYYNFYEIQELFGWTLPKNVNHCPFDFNQMLAISVNRLRYGGKFPLATCMGATHLSNRDEMLEIIDSTELYESDEFSSSAVLSLANAERTRKLFKVFEGAYLAPIAESEEDSDGGETTSPTNEQVLEQRANEGILPEDL